MEILPHAGQRLCVVITTYGCCLSSFVMEKLSLLLSVKLRSLYHRFLYNGNITCYSDVRKNRARPGKEKDMTAVWFALSEKEHMELQSSFNYLDRLFARSYKAKKNRNGIS